AGELVVALLGRDVGQVVDRVLDAVRIGQLAMLREALLVEGDGRGVVALHVGEDARAREGIGAQARYLPVGRGQRPLEPLASLVESAPNLPVAPQARGEAQARRPAAGF